MKKHYREFICCVCGGVGIDRGLRQDAKFCGSKCRNYAHARKHEFLNDHPCKYNYGVSCFDQKCEGCGWNPDVQKARKEKIYGEE